MKKRKFTNEGIQLLLAEIYQLSVIDYQQEIQNMRQDFGLWLLTHFDFNSQQAQYLNQLETDYLYLLGKEVSYTIESQGSIVLQQEGSDDDDGEGKVIETNSVLQTLFNLEEGVQRVSTLIINIRYTGII